jgi:hypothetical protein
MDSTDSGCLVTSFKAFPVDAPKGDFGLVRITEPLFKVGLLSKDESTLVVPGKAVPVPAFRYSLTDEGRKSVRSHRGKDDLQFFVAESRS